MRRTAIAVLAALLLASAHANAASADAPREPHRKCSDLCARYYNDDEAKRTLCQDGCGAAERCVTDCSTRFAENDEQRQRCHARCARR